MGVEVGVEIGWQSVLILETMMTMQIIILITWLMVGERLKTFLTSVQNMSVNIQTSEVVRQ